MDERRKSILKNGAVLLLALVTILAVILPMSLAPLWNGENPGHREQYREAARSFLEGHLDLTYEGKAPSEKLKTLENPYDPAERKKAGLVQNRDYLWDHAYFEGKYYMYFGVVPVFLVFLPYQVLTGQGLASYHGTQVFAAVFILGLFALFFRLRKRFFPKFSALVSAAIASALSVASLWYASAAPALYCTAITAGLATEIWSLFFFVTAVYETKNENKAVLFAALGALFGALTFGCRPPVALANLLVLPLLVSFLRRRRITGRLLLKLAAAALPYALVAALLLWYNDARFGNAFEFGQHYQLTVADQTGAFTLTWEQYGKALEYYLLNLKNVKKAVHYGLLWTFPALWLPYFCLVRPKAAKNLLHSLLPFFIAVVAMPFLIIAIDTLGSPVSVPRYRLDFTWLFALGAFLPLGFFGNELKSRAGKAVFYGAVVLLALGTVAVAVWLFFCPYDANYAASVLKLEPY